MKKLTVLMMALLLLLGLTACGGSSTAQPADSQPVQTSEQPEASASAVATPSLLITQEQLDKITAIVDQMAPLYNEAETKAQENGWLSDETTTNELAAIYAVVQSASEGLADPSMFNDMEDMDGYIEAMQAMLDELPNVLAKVSEPYAG